MNVKTRRRLIENLTNAFSAVLVEREGSKVARYVKKINREIIDNIESITADRVKQLIEETPLKIGNATMMALVLSSITQILEDQRMNRRKKQAMQGIIAVSAMFNLKQATSYKKAETFARNIHSSISAPKGNVYKKASSQLNAFKSNNADMYNKARVTTERNIRQAQLVSKRSMSKAVLSEYQKMVEEGKPRESIRYHLQRRYNNEASVRRAVETESHNQIESTKRIQAEEIGYTHKTWFTQSDPKVRGTRFHKGVHGKKVPIDSEFRAGGQSANNPSDMKLKPKDRINCRCYLIYS